jgi:hypothetical protein
MCAPRLATEIAEVEWSLFHEKALLAEISGSPISLNLMNSGSFGRKIVQSAKIRTIGLPLFFANRAFSQINDIWTSAILAGVRSIMEDIYNLS